MVCPLTRRKQSARQMLHPPVKQAVSPEFEQGEGITFRKHTGIRRVEYLSFHPVFNIFFIKNKAMLHLNFFSKLDLKKIEK